MNRPRTPATTHASLDSLWERAVGGDSTAEESVFELLRDRFFVLARSVMSDEDAKDVAQEACLTVLAGYRNLRSPYRYQAYAHKVFRSRVADYIQHRKTSRRHVVLAGDPETLAERSSASQDPDLVRALARCLRKLTVKFPRYARAINLVHLGYETDQICNRMGISRNHLYVLLNRGRNLLRQCLDEKDGA